MHRIALVAVALAACGVPQPAPDVRDSVAETASDSGFPVDQPASDDTIDVINAIDAPLDATDGYSDPWPLPDLIVPDVPQVDVIETGADVQDASCDACVEGTYRCSSAGRLEKCTRTNGCAAWGPNLFYSCPNTEPCDQNACVLCGTGDAGSCPSSCSTDVECANRGRARCVNAHCARRGWVACATLADCNAVNIGTTSSGCVPSTFNGRTAMVCGGDSVVPCTSDVMCPAAFAGNPAYRCDIATGFCVP